MFALRRLAAGRRLGGSLPSLRPVRRAGRLERGSLGFPALARGAHHELSLDSLIAAIGATGQQPADTDAHHYILAAAMMALREQEAGRELSDADVHYYRGIALAAQKKLEQAVAEFATALRLRPDFAEAHNDFGNALRDQGKLEDAIAAYHTAIRVKPDFAYPHYNLGFILAAEGNLEEAIAEFRSAVRISPDDLAAHNELGLALHDQGKLEEAIAEFRAAIRIDPDCARPTPTWAWRSTRGEEWMRR